MAKLSARGRTEIYRLTRDGAKKMLMSDRVILWNGGGGWKKMGRLKTEITSEKWLEHRLAEGWERLN